MPKSSPTRYSANMDNYYDPEFTAQISSNMQVPEKLSVIGGAEIKSYVPLPEEKRQIMQVPERIIVAGGDEHIACREPVPEMRLETSMSVAPPANVLPPPPRVLSLNEYSYPDIEYEPKVNHKTTIPKSKILANGMGDINESAVSIYHAPEDENALLMTHIKLLRQRVAILESDNQMRQQREFILYSTGIMYFIFKGLMWLHRHL